MKWWGREKEVKGRGGVRATVQSRNKCWRVRLGTGKTASPLTTMLKDGAAQQDIPVIGWSESLQPPMATFED